MIDALHYTQMMIQISFPPFLPPPLYLDKTRTDDDVSPIGWPPFYGLPHSLSTPTRSSQLHCATEHGGREGEANMFLLAANHAALRWISPQRHRGKLRPCCPGFRRAVALPSVSGAAAAAVDNDERQPTNQPASERARGRNEHLPRASEVGGRAFSRRSPGT